VVLGSRAERVADSVDATRVTSGRGTAVGADLAQLAKQTRAGRPALGEVMQGMLPGRFL
jgi:hypothetical protein